MEWATDAKSTVEEAQREDRKRREEKGERHVPRFFELKEGRWVPKLKYVYSHHTCTLINPSCSLQYSKGPSGSHQDSTGMDLPIGTRCSSTSVTAARNGDGNSVDGCRRRASSHSHWYLVPLVLVRYDDLCSRSR